MLLIPRCFYSKKDSVLRVDFDCFEYAKGQVPDLGIWRLQVGDYNLTQSFDLKSFRGAIPSEDLGKLQGSLMSLVTPNSCIKFRVHLELV